MAKRRKKYRRNPDPLMFGGIGSPQGGGGGAVGAVADVGNKLLAAIAGVFAPPAAPAEERKAILVRGASKLKALRAGKPVSLKGAAADIATLRAGASAAAEAAEKARADAAKKKLDGSISNAEYYEMLAYADSQEKLAADLEKQFKKAMDMLGASPLAAVASVVGGASASAAPKRGGRKAKPKGGKRGGRRKGRGAYISKTKKGRISKASLKRLKRIAGSRASYMGKGKNRKMVIKMNPGVGGIVGLVSAAAGMGAGYVLATNVVPKLVGRVVPQAATGLVGLAVGGAGGYALSRLVARWNPSVASQLYVGALAAVGAGIVAAVVKMLPANIKAPLGLGRMNDYLQLSGRRGVGDYLQLSGPVPEQLFAGGLNDYVDFTSPAAGKAAEAISSQLVDWTPTGNEGF